MEVFGQSARNPPGLVPTEPILNQSPPTSTFASRHAAATFPVSPIVAVSALCSATIALFIYYLFLLPFVHEFGTFVWNGSNIPRPTGSRQFPCCLEARSLREDCRVRQRAYLVVQPILKDHLFIPRINLVSKESRTSISEFAWNSHNIKNRKSILNIFKQFSTGIQQFVYSNKFQKINSKLFN